MWRYVVGLAAGLLLALGGVLWFRPNAVAGRAGEVLADRLAAPAPPARDDAPPPDVPTASDKTREEKRFSRYDRDRNGAVSREEWLAGRRKAFAKLDTNGDGRLSFDEWAAKTEKRFADADANHDAVLTAGEFAATRIQRKSHAPVRCAPSEPKSGDDDAG